MIAAERTAKTTRIGMAATSVCSVDREFIGLNMTEINRIVNDKGRTLVIFLKLVESLALLGFRGQR